MVRKFLQRKTAQFKDEWAASSAELDVIAKIRGDWTAGPGQGQWPTGRYATPEPCHVLGCDEPLKVRGLCRKHAKATR